MAFYYTILNKTDFLYYKKKVLFGVIQPTFPPFLMFIITYFEYMYAISDSNRKHVSYSKSRIIEYKEGAIGFPYTLLCGFWTEELVIAYNNNNKDCKQ